MRSWKHGKSSIYFVEKGTNGVGNNRNTKSIGGIVNYHTITVDSLNATKQEYDKFFKLLLNNFTVKVNDRVLNNSEDMEKYFTDYSDWIIHDSLGKQISSNQKYYIETMIKSTYDKTIEEEWGTKYESNWNNIKNSIIDTVSKNTNLRVIPGTMRDKLIEFMVSIEWRTRPYPDAFQATWHNVYGRFVGNLFDFIPLNEQKGLFPFNTSIEEEFQHAYILNQFKSFFKGEGNIMMAVKDIVENCCIELLIAPDNGEFITSDNPVCRFTNQDSKLECIFPITTNIACRIGTVEGIDFRNNYLVSNISKIELNDYNNKLKDNCYKGYILRVQDRDLYFSDY